MDIGRREFIGATALWPEFDDGLSDEDRDLADRVLRLPLLFIADGDLGPAIARTDETLWFAIAEGAVLKETELLGRKALEVLGPGDILAPPLSADQQLESEAVSRYLAHGSVSLVVINQTFWVGARRWPMLLDLLHRRLAEQAHRASAHLTMLHLTRAEDRLMTLFSELGRRYGHVRGDTVTLNLQLTHEMIGRLIGSRRSTTSLALSGIQDWISRHHDGTWRIALALVSR